MALTINGVYTYTKPLNNVYVDSEGNVLDPDVPSARGTIQLPEITINTPDWKDMVGRYSIASNDALRVTGLRPQNSHLNKQTEEGATRHAVWAKENPGLETAGLVAGAVPFAVAATPAIVGGGELAYPILTNSYVDAGITSAFAGHGLNHAINEGINGWGDAAMTALELAPLGRLAKPLWNAAKSTRNFIPTLESNMSGVRYAYNRNPELANIGTLEDYNDYLKTVFPESKVRDINYHMGPKGLQELKPSTGEVYNTNPDARGIYVTPDKSYAQRLRKYTTDRLEKPSFLTYLKRNLTPGGWNKANDAFTDIYPVMIDTKNPLLTKGTWTWGIKDKKYQSLMGDYDAIVNSGPKWYQNFNSMPETIVPKTEQSLILGSDADVAGFRRFMSNPQITAENAANITPEQWTATQDAAIAKGDMAEAQRLRDLHASVNGYNPSLSLYHGSSKTFNEFKAVPNFEDYVDYHSHFGTIPATASKFGDIRRFYTNVKNPLRVTDQGARWEPQSLARELGIQPKYVKDPLEPYWREFQNIEGRGMYKEANRKFMEDELKGDAYIYDNAVEGGGDSYAIPTSRQVKLADAVTYDDKGVRIPLGERDNFNINDIRYGLLPFLGLGAAGALYKNLK